MKLRIAYFVPAHLFLGMLLLAGALGCSKSLKSSQSGTDGSQPPDIEVGRDSMLGPMKIGVGGSCILNSECNASLVCITGKCHDGCHTTADCPGAQSCIISSSQSKVCQLPSETYCTHNSDCLSPLACGADQRCRNQCQQDVDCTPGQTCTTTKTCAEPNQVDSNNNLVGTDGGVSWCPVGAETCLCYPDYACNAGLTCAYHLCVNLGAPTADGGGNASCSDNGRCAQDSAPTAAGIAYCQSALAAACGSQYQALMNCTKSNEECDSTGAMDLTALLAACGTQIDSYTTCCTLNPTACP